MKFWWQVICLLLMPSLAYLSSGATAQSVFGQTNSDEQQDQVAARIDRYVVLVSEVDKQVDALVGTEKISDAARLAMQHAALSELVNRQLVLHYLDRKGYLPNQTQLNIRLDLLNEGFASAGTTLEAHLKSARISRQKFLESLRWKMGWQKYLEKYMTDDNIAAFFEKHQPDFDGRKVGVAHILLKVAKDAPVEAWQAATETLTRVRQEIEGGKLTFAEAAAKYSQASTAKAGGSMGLIERHQPMHESFTAAAFSLKQYEISQPVRSPFGVHLIQCVQIQQGKQTWKSTRDQIEPAIRKFLFQWLADRELKTTKVAYTGAIRPLE